MRFAISLVEQGLGSIITFGINLWLIRVGVAASYGIYVFWYSLAWMLGTCQGTLVITHLFNLPPAADQRREPERLLLSVNLVLLVVLGLCVLGLALALRATGSTLSEPIAAIFIPAFLLYQYTRAFAFSRGRLMLGAMLTGSVLVCGVVGLGVDHLAGNDADAARVLAIVGAAYGVCATGVLFILLRGMTPMFRPSEMRRYLPYLRGSGWMMLGALAGEAISRLYSFVVVGRFGTEALGRLSAVQVVIRPAWLLSSAWSSIGFPAMAAQRSANDRRGFVLSIIIGAASTSLGSLLWSIAVLALWPEIVGTLYRGRYLDAGGLAYLWTGNVLLGSVAMAMNIGLLVLGEFRRLALLDLVGAALCIFCLSLLGRFGRFDYPFAIVATMVGQVSQIALMGLVLSRRLSSSRPIGAS